MVENMEKSFDDGLDDKITCKTPTITINGHLQDVIKDGSSEKEIDQGNNQICIGCHELICELISGLEEKEKDQLYFAVGSSDEKATSNDSGLVKLLFKHKIFEKTADGKEGIKINGNVLTLTAYFYGEPDPNLDVDDDGNPVSSENYNTEWRECAIYKGDTMLNRKIHDPIVKNSSIEAMRTFKFTF